MAILHKLIYGQRVELFGYAFLPKSPTNPCEFDYKSYLRRQMPSVRCLMTVVDTNNIKIRGSSHNNWMYRFIYALSNILNNTIYTHTFSNSAPLISSMLLGNRVDLSNETIDNFMKTGIIHFIAISGFNVGIVVFTVLLPLRLFGINQTLSTSIILLVVVPIRLFNRTEPTSASCKHNGLYFLLRFPCAQTVGYYQRYFCGYIFYPCQESIRYFQYRVSAIGIGNNGDCLWSIKD